MTYVLNTAAIFCFFMYPEIVVAIENLPTINEGVIEINGSQNFGGWETNVIFAILGAFLSAIFSPVVAVFFKRWSSSKENAFNITNGLIFLGAANAFWVLTFLISDPSFIEHNGRISQSLPIMLYFISTIFFLIAMEQFFRSEREEDSLLLAFALLSIAAGNMFWLFYDAYEVLNKFEKIQLVITYLPDFYPSLDTDQAKDIMGTLLTFSVILFLISTLLILAYMLIIVIRNQFIKIKLNMESKKMQDAKNKIYFLYWENLPDNEKTKHLEKIFRENNAS